MRYGQSAGAFLDWYAAAGMRSVAAVQPTHVTAWIERQTHEHSASTTKQSLSALRHLFDWLVIGQVLPAKPAAAVSGRRHSALKGKTPVLDATEGRLLLGRIDVATPAGLRDRALVALMVYVGAPACARSVAAALPAFRPGGSGWSGPALQGGGLAAAEWSRSVLKTGAAPG